MNTNSINLLPSKSALTVTEQASLARLKIISVVVSIVIVVCGFLLGTAYFIERVQFTQLDDQKAKYLQSINAQAKKQILLLSTKERIPLIGNALNSQFPWEKILSDIIQLAPPPLLKGLKVEDNGLLTVTAQTNSIEEVQKMVDVALQLEVDKKIKTPLIESLQIGKDQQIEVIFTYSPIF